MESVLKVIENAIDDGPSYNASSLWHFYATFYTITEYINEILSFFAVIFDCLVLWILIRQSKMRSPWYTLLANFTVFDCLYNMNIMSWIFFVFPMHNEEIDTVLVQYCVISHFQLITRYCGVIMILLILRNTIVQYKRIDDVTLITILHLTLIILTIINISICDAEIEIFYTSVHLVFFGLFIIFFLYEIYMAFRVYVRKYAMPNDVRIQINVARIFTYLHLSVFFTFYIDWDAVGVYAQLAELLMPGIPMFVLIYLIFADRNFQISIKNIVKCGRAEEIDSEILVYDEEDRQTIEIDFNKIEEN